MQGKQIQIFFILSGFSGALRFGFQTNLVAKGQPQQRPYWQYASSRLGLHHWGYQVR